MFLSSHCWSISSANQLQDKQAHHLIWSCIRQEEHPTLVRAFISQTRAPCMTGQGCHVPSRITIKEARCLAAAQKSRMKQSIIRQMLQEWYTRHCCLSLYVYMFMPKELNELPDDHTIDETVVLHFCGENKPWAICPTSTRFKEACNQWYSYDENSSRFHVSRLCPECWHDSEAK